MFASVSFSECLKKREGADMYGGTEVEWVDMLKGSVGRGERVTKGSER